MNINKSEELLKKGLEVCNKMISLNMEAFEGGLITESEMREDSKKWVEKMENLLAVYKSIPEKHD